VNPRLIALLLPLLAAAPSFVPSSAVAAGGEQDAVRLRNGRVISGEVAVDEKDDEGFTVSCWDTGVVLRVLWSQVSETERNRLLRRTPEPAPREALVDGVLVITSARDALGVVVKDEPTQLHIKTSRSEKPVVIPKSAILRKLPARIFESEAFTEEEMIRRRADAAGENDAPARIAVGRFAARLKRYDLARGYFEQAAKADPARQAEVAALIQENERLIVEERATAALGEVRSALDELDHARAMELARKFLADFGETRVAQANGTLVEEIEKEAKEYAIHRAEVLAKKVPNLWRSKRSQLVARAAQLPFPEARAQVAKFDEEIELDLARRLKAAVSEIQVAWQNREEKSRVASYGSGTWIARGGQNGGLDFTMPPPEPAPPDPNPTMIAIRVGNYILWVPATAPGAKPKELGRPLLRQEEWWAQVGLYDRRSWLEAEYASTSGRVRRLEERTRKCAACNGGGALLTSRFNVTVPVICPRCHGVKEDVAISYW
jgi:tetratricopeptide (TPR) repeat protein